LSIAATDKSDVSASFDPEGRRLLSQGWDLAGREASVFDVLSLDLGTMSSDRDLMAAVLANAVQEPQARRAVLMTATEVFRRDPDVPRASMIDVAVTTVRNFEPGGEIATLLFSRGIHAVLAHRVAHALWQGGRKELALAMKTIFGRAFATDIHPGAVFGRGVWLDHGLGFVVGETAEIEDDVSIWHGVTLGSTLKDSSDRRHPRLRRGCTIGADTIILGGIDIGEGSVVAAGSIVLTPVAPGTTVAGAPARQKPRSATSFSGF